MTQYTSVVNKAGRITIPAEIRQQFGIRPKDLVRFEVRNGVIAIVPVRSRPAAHGTVVSTSSAVPDR